MEIRNTKIEELPRLLEIYKNAREFMKNHGNATQWGASYPEEDLVRQDIMAGHSYVCIHEEEIVGTFFFAIGPDKTYAIIEDGTWLNDREYAVVHRVAIEKRGIGVASYCINWAYEQYPNIKIDTHKNNHAMQAMLKKNGFTQCGTIYLEDGSTRLAYQKQ